MAESAPTLARVQETVVPIPTDGGPETASPETHPDDRARMLLGNLYSGHGANPPPPEARPGGAADGQEPRLVPRPPLRVLAQRALSTHRRAFQSADLIALQRLAGNRAVCGVLQRVPTGGATATDVTFTIGTEIQPAFAAAAKTAVADGRVDAADLEAMRQAALADDESVSDDERMFMAGLLDPANLQRLRRLRSFAAAPDTITFPISSITPGRRTQIANLDRPTLPADVANELSLADQAAKGIGSDVFAKTAATVAHWKAAEVAAARAAVKMADTFAPTAQNALTVAGVWNVSPIDVLRAMIAAASDSTPGDLALAAVVYVIARLTGSPLAADILAGQIKVDEVPHSKMRPGEWAGYKAAGAGEKGDTIYVPTDLDIYNLAHRGAVVHELEHAAQDKAATGAKVQRGKRDEGELLAYRKQARFLLDTVGGIGASGGAAIQETAVKQIATIWNPLVLGALILEALSDAARLKPVILRINDAAPATGRAQKADIETAFTWNPTRLEVRLLGLIRKEYGITTPSGNVALQEGLSGESVLDWINRPMGP
jgi:hypothetical protein